MGLDARSRQRLEELGRRLPTPLPQPEPSPQREAGPKGAGRHAIETETDPERLFQQLMQASADGTVPPHLLERLRQAEAQRSSRAASQTLKRNSPGVTRQRNPATQNRRAQGQDPQYVAFEQMLLEDEHDGKGDLEA